MLFFIIILSFNVVLKLWNSLWNSQLFSTVYLTCAFQRFASAPAIMRSSQGVMGLIPHFLLGCLNYVAFFLTKRLEFIFHIISLIFCYKFWSPANKSALPTVQSSANVLSKMLPSSNSSSHFHSPSASRQHFPEGKERRSLRHHIQQSVPGAPRPTQGPQAFVIYRGHQSCLPVLLIVSSSDAVFKKQNN